MRRAHTPVASRLATVTRPWWTARRPPPGWRTAAHKRAWTDCPGCGPGRGSLRWSRTARGSGPAMPASRARVWRRARQAAGLRARGLQARRSARAARPGRTAADVEPRRGVCQTGDVAEQRMRAAVLEGVRKVALQDGGFPGQAGAKCWSRSRRPAPAGRMCTTTSTGASAPSWSPRRWSSGTRDLRGDRRGESRAGYRPLYPGLLAVTRSAQPHPATASGQKCGR